MKTKSMLFGAAAIAAASMIVGCHDHHSTPPPPAQTSQSLDTAQVLALAQQTSETAAPIPVNGGAVVLNDTSDTAPPLAINAM